jgi:hypothetical protein
MRNMSKSTTETENYSKGNYVYFPSNVIPLQLHGAIREHVVFGNNMGIWHALTVHLGNTLSFHYFAFSYTLILVIFKVLSFGIRS